MQVPRFPQNLLGANEGVQPLLTTARLAALGRTAGTSLELKPAGVPFEQWLALYRAFADLADPRAWAGIAGAEARLREQQAGLQKVHRSRSG